MASFKQFYKDMNEKFLRFQFGSKERKTIYERLANYIDNGVRLSDALKLIYDHETDDGKNLSTGSGAALRDWMRKNEGGFALGDCVDGWVPERDRHLIAAGAKSNLVKALRNAAEMETGMKQIKSSIRSALAYPAVLFVGVIGILLYFSYYLGPIIGSVVPRDKWTGSLAALGDVSDFIASNIIILILAVSFLIGVVIWTMPRWTGPVRLRFDEFPPWSMYRMIEGTGFLLSVSALIRAGVAEHKVIDILARTASPWYRERLSKARQIMMNGHSIGEALWMSKMNFPDKNTVREMRAYASMNKFEEMLEKAGHDRLSENIKKVEAVSGVMRIASMGVVGGILAWISLSVMSISQVASSITH